MAYNRNTGLASRELVPFSSWTKKNDIAPLKRKLSRLLCNGFIYSRWYSLPFKYCLCADHTRLEPADILLSYCFISLNEIAQSAAMELHSQGVLPVQLNCHLEYTYTKVENCQILFLLKNTISFLPQNSPITCFLSNSTFSGLTKQKLQMVPFI